MVRGLESGAAARRVTGPPAKVGSDLLTLIIPTHKRPDFLRRLLLYLKTMHFQHPILVADSSPQRESKLNRSVVNSVEEVLKVNYKRYDSSVYPFSKIAKALSLVDTEYSAICADDDFIVPRALDECTQFLERNNDYSMIHGSVLSVYATKYILRERSFDWGAVESSQTSSDLWFRQNTRGPIANSDPMIRLRDHLLDYDATFYSVHRRPDYARNMKITSKLTRDFFLGELLLTCLCIIQGKLGCLGQLYAVRPYHPPDWVAAMGKRLDLPDLLTSEDFSQRYVNLRDCLTDELVSQTDVSPRKAKESLNRIFQLYMIKYLHHFYDPPIQRRPFRQVHRRLWKPLALANALTEVALAAVQDQEISIFVRKPRAYTRLTVARKRVMSQGYEPLHRLLDPASPFHTDFMPIYECLVQNRDGEGKLAKG